MTPFIHRENKNGSWDSICPLCLLTVVSKANVRTEAELLATDSDHTCEVSNNDVARNKV